MACMSHPLTHPTPYALGLQRLCAIEATHTPSISVALADISPDLARLAIGFVYGEIYQRPQLSTRSRQLASVSMLAALGHAKPQLKFHLGAALNVGCTACELVELMIHLAVYAGFPVALNGIFAAREVFQERGLSHTPTHISTPAGERFSRGLGMLSAVDGHAGEAVVAALQDTAPDLARFVVEFAFGDVYTRPGLGLLERELVTVAALTAMGTAAPQLCVHMHGLLNVGGTREQLLELALQAAAYAGFPAAINATLLAKQVLAQRAGEPAPEPATPTQPTSSEQAAAPH